MSMIMLLWILIDLVSVVSCLISLWFVSVLVGTKYYFIKSIAAILNFF